MRLHARARRKTCSFQANNKQMELFVKGVKAYMGTVGSLCGPLLETPERSGVFF